MTSIPVGIYRISRNNLKRHYLRKKRLFFLFFIKFLKCAWNLDYFFKQDLYPRLIISEIFDAEKRGYLNVYRVLLQNTIR